MSSDPDIWNRISQNDAEAYAIMYRDYFNRFFNYGKKFISDESLIEDAAQETLLLVWENRASLSSIKFSGTYFYSTFRNILISKIRKRHASELPEETLEEPGFNVEQLILKRDTDEEIKLKLHGAIQNLTARQREAIFLRFYEGFSYDEVSSILNITIKSTYKIMARAIATLKEKMVFTTSVAFVALLCEILF